MSRPSLESFAPYGATPFGPGAIQAFGSKALYVDPTRTNGGLGTERSPLSSFTEAYSRLRSGKGDTIYLIGGPTSGGTTGMTVRLSSAFDWAKHNCGLVGVCAPVHYGQRSRFTGPSTGGTFSPLITVSGSGNSMVNFSIFDDYTVDPVALKVTGQRNYFGNVNMQGMGAATGADDASGASLWLAAGAENRFEKCVIGLDTVPRSTTNGEILMTAAAKRNRFDECHIKSYSDNAGHLFVKAANSGDLDRETTFWKCIFENCPTGIASGTTMTQAMNVHASAGGMILLYDCMLVGATDWAAADNGNVIAYGSSVTAGTVGLAAAVTR